MNIFIKTNESLQKHCEQMWKQPFIAIDTEFIANNSSYYPDLSLIQIAYACPDKENLHKIEDASSVISSSNKDLIIVLIDAKAGLNMNFLKEILENKQIIKVIHACQHDHLALKFNMKCQMQGIFDTQIARAFISEHRMISYRALVEHYCGIKLDKNQQMSDWLKRPLDRRQLDYAANDVNYLYKIYPIIFEEIKQRNYGKWVEEEVQNSIIEIEDNKNKIEKIFMNILFKEAPDLDNQKMAPYLMRLIKLREDIAQQNNIGRQNIISDKNLQNIVYCIIEEKNKIPVSILRINASFNLGSEKIKEIMSEINEYEVNEYKKIKKEMLKYYDTSHFARNLINLLNQVSQETGISADLIVNNAELRHITSIDQCDKLKHGWRYEVFGKKAKEIISQ